MAIQTLNYCTKTQIECSVFPADAFLCVPASIVLNGFGFIRATIESVRESTCVDPCGPCGFVYTITYDDAQLVPGMLLVAASIKRFICDSCLVDILLSLALTFNDSPTIDFTVSGTDVTAEAVISADAGNCLEEHADGLFSPCLDAVYNDTTTVDFTVVGSDVSADVKISADAGNEISVHADGIYAPPICVGLSTNINFVINPSGCITGAVKISADANNQLSDHADGLYAASPILTVSDTPTVDLALVASDLSAAVKISADANNCLEAHADGLYIACATEFISSVADTTTVDLSVGAGILSAAVVVSPDANNALTAIANGLFVAGNILTVTDSSSVNLTITGSAPQDLTAAVVVSSDALNILESRANGLWVPAQDAWLPFNVTLTRTNTTHFTLPGDWTNILTVGTKIKLDQTTTKYFYVTAPTIFAAGTSTVEARAGDDYSLAAAAITNPFFSHAESPPGFPGRFTYTPSTISGFSVAPSTKAQFYLEGIWCTVTFATNVNGTSSDGSFNILLPIVAATDGSNQWISAVPQATDNGVSIDTAFAVITSAASLIVLSKSAGTPAWTGANAKGANFNISYPIL